MTTPRDHMIPHSLLREGFKDHSHCVLESGSSAFLSNDQSLQQHLNVLRPVPAVALLLRLELVLVWSVPRQCCLRHFQLVTVPATPPVDNLLVEHKDSGQ